MKLKALQKGHWRGNTTVPTRYRNSLKPRDSLKPSYQLLVIFSEMNDITFNFRWSIGSYNIPFDNSLHQKNKISFLRNNSALDLYLEVPH